MRRREEHLLHQDCVRGRGSSSGESDDQGDMRGVACEPKFETHWCPNRSALIPSIDVSAEHKPLRANQDELSAVIDRKKRR